MDTAGGRTGRPRSEEARSAVLYAVDDLLVEVGYSGLTMKGIAERAGVGRQTLYRWWSTKAEILFEAAWYDATKELALPPTDSMRADATEFLRRLVDFLTTADAGAAYRALVAAAQQDAAVAALMGSGDVLANAAREILQPRAKTLRVELDDAIALLVGPVFFSVLTGTRPASAETAAEAFLRAVGSTDS